ncbi:hypothetical protein ABE82_26000 (plasmid) [Paenibacillus peoriae]|uniref:hypothetical protein n=1 Tax=Paenibacillus peoriae TaxID=59893 RepID=UPI000722EAB1|nr:hypothetical protein [Paenibacillus peoriae]ALS09874.1 hypothetical protein ABE82_26000 [Paenibacillus peoriae]
MKTVIEFLKNPDNQKKPVLELIQTIQQYSSTDPNYLQVLKFVIRGLEFVEKHGLPLAKQIYYTDLREDGRPYTIQLIKELRDHVPLLEFRINWEGFGAFRSVFFEYCRDNYQFLVFARAIIKQTTYSDDFEQIVQETEQLYEDFINNPEKYITLTGVDQNETS